jgi:hypothetical protein
MRLMMPKQDGLTKRQQAQVYFATGFTWQAACELAGYDEEADMREDVLSWALLMAGFAVFLVLVLPLILQVIA